jgi:hypothetical protein
MYVVLCFYLPHNGFEFEKTVRRDGITAEYSGLVAEVSKAGKPSRNAGGEWNDRRRFSLIAVVTNASRVVLPFREPDAGLFRPAQYVPP